MAMEWMTYWPVELPRVNESIAFDVLHYEHCACVHRYLPNVERQFAGNQFINIREQNERFCPKANLIKTLRLTVL